MVIGRQHLGVGQFRQAPARARVEDHEVGRAVAVLVLDRGQDQGVTVKLAMYRGVGHIADRPGVQRAMAESRGRTQPIPYICPALCSGSGGVVYPPATDRSGVNIAYTKPIVLLRNPMLGDVSDADLRAQFDLGIKVRNNLTEADSAVIRVRDVNRMIADRLGRSADSSLQRQGKQIMSTLGEVESHPHNVARATFVRRDGVLQPGPAPRFSRTACEMGPPARGRGADSEAVLKDWGFASVEIAELTKVGVVGAAKSGT